MVPPKSLRSRNPGPAKSGAANAPEADTCTTCANPRGTKNPASRDTLLSNSHLDDDFSLKGCSVPLADGSHSQPIDVLVYVTATPIVPKWHGERLPLMTFRGEAIEIFLDPSHPVFRAYHTRPEVLIATEVAQYIHVVNGSLQAKYSGQHSVSNLTWTVLERRWADRLEDSPERVKVDSRSLFDTVRTSLGAVAGPEASEFFGELTEAQMTTLVANLLGEAWTSGKSRDCAHLANMYCFWMRPRLSISTAGPLSCLWTDAFGAIPTAP